MAATTTGTSSTPSYTVEHTPFPAPSKTISGYANDTLTTVTRMSFTDRLLLTISQGERSFSHWIHVPLASASSSENVNPMGRNTNYSHSDLDEDDGDSDLLPRSDLTATTLLGGTKREDEMVGQTLATMIGSAVLMKRPREERLLVLGLGLQGVGGMGRQGFEEVARTDGRRGRLPSQCEERMERWLLGSQSRDTLGRGLCGARVERRTVSRDEPHDANHEQLDCSATIYNDRKTLRKLHNHLKKAGMWSAKTEEMTLDVGKRALTGVHKNAKTLQPSSKLLESPRSEIAILSSSSKSRTTEIRRDCLA
ncbi:hypothetical protein LTR35_014763 [Friedmanniomyces endolithicus]|uniref:Uncharacterized protein n=1 Tax=Friedmanniomyces endolithicus TaxID=329885 RepID=A0AAN6J2T6_9PEZI|nr:hypothetical protein LTR35_014763 [Friedmanniomyces endolithicus]KAK0279264.1 hypothetical protein LTS00_013537 [Friedmanniomyces endolithicus]KAK0311663.1 hypothetical protein LTR82_014192 [Friedmanniomyces endolithicus]KAK0984504.1 hypothetical protein LTR54_014002 [Friedmanniomyces endolithicus]